VKSAWIMMQGLQEDRLKNHLRDCITCLSNRPCTRPFCWCSVIHWLVIAVIT